MEASKRIQQEEFCGLVLTYRINDTLLCAPVELVESVIEPPAVTAIPHAPDYVIGAFLYRGETALAVSLRQLLKLPPTVNKPRKESLLVVRMDNQAIGYWVDEIKGMTDSSRGHWSAVPALVSEQGITRALVCDGLVYFPLDLSQSSQFKELSRTLEVFENSELPILIEEPVAEQVGQPDPPEQETTTDERLPDPEARDDAVTPAFSGNTPFVAPQGGHIAAEPRDAQSPLSADTPGLAAPEAEVIPIRRMPKVQFDATGQGDAFLDRLPPGESRQAVDEQGEDHRDAGSNQQAVTDGQMDAFAERYQALLREDSLGVDGVETLHDESLRVEEPVALLSESLADEEDDETDLLAGTTDSDTDELIADTSLTQTDDADAEQRLAELDAFCAEQESLAEKRSEETVDDGLVPADEAQALLPEPLADEEGDETKVAPDVADVDTGAIADPSPMASVATGDADTVHDPEQRLAELDAFCAKEQTSAGLLSEEAADDERILSDEPTALLSESLTDDDETIALHEPGESSADNASGQPPSAESDESVMADAAFAADDDLLSEPLGDEAVLGDLTLIEEPYSLLPTSLPEDPGGVDVEDSLEEAGELTAGEGLDHEPLAEAHEPVMAEEARLAAQRQAEIDAAFGAEGDAFGEPASDDTAIDSLTLLEEPYSLLPASLPEDDDIGPALPDGDDEQLAEAAPETDIDEGQGPADGLDALLPLSLAEQGGGAIQAVTDAGPPVADTQAAVALLPYLPVDGVEDTLPTNAGAETSMSSGPERDERPVIALPFVDAEAAVPPEVERVLAEAEYYTELMAGALKDSVSDTPLEDIPPQTVQPADESLPPEDVPGEAPESKSADIYVFKLPQVSAQVDEPVPLPSLGEKHTTPKLDPGGIIIRPDGQINKSFGLVKLFTIILATSTAGAWWFRDELFHREQFKKEVSSILQNEIAFLYSNRVRISAPQRGQERVVVDTPEQEIKVIRAQYVNGALLRQRRQKGVTIHRVKKGDTLWAIAERYLDDPYRYPELAENNRIHTPDLIRPGDVVKITDKTTDNDRP